MAADASEARRRFKAAAAGALKAIGEDMLGEAQRRAPVEEGTLRASGDLELDVAGPVMTATVSFNTVYAARQHEELDWQHPKGGQAKYLESVLLERAPRYAAILEAAMRKAL